MLRARWTFKITVTIFLMHVLSRSRTKPFIQFNLRHYSCATGLWWLYFGWSRLRTQECAQEMERILGVQIRVGLGDSLEQSV